ncbi:MAG: hypothetical protein L7F77_13050 [Candidatus Magnetominusculus sp. LBB02]|nr:hypothetical protein [Candidatus Magnetominusculus sp. LBB02]
MRTKLHIGFECDYTYQNFQRDDPDIPYMTYTWEITDILVDSITQWNGKTYFNDLPVANITSDGSIYKRIKQTDGNNDCDGSASYIYLCKKLD